MNSWIVEKFISFIFCSSIYTSKIPLRMHAIYFSHFSLHSVLIFVKLLLFLCFLIICFLLHTDYKFISIQWLFCDKNVTLLMIKILIVPTSYNSLRVPHIYRPKRSSYEIHIGTAIVEFAACLYSPHVKWLKWLKWSLEFVFIITATIVIVMDILTNELMTFCKSVFLNYCNIINPKNTVLVGFEDD